MIHDVKQPAHRKVGKQSLWRLLTDPTMHACVRERSAEKTLVRLRAARLSVFPLPVCETGKGTPKHLLRGVPRYLHPEKGSGSARLSALHRDVLSASGLPRPPLKASGRIVVSGGAPVAARAQVTSALPAGAAPNSISRADVFRKTPSPSRDAGDQA